MQVGAVGDPASPPGCTPVTAHPTHPAARPCRPGPCPPGLLSCRQPRESLPQPPPDVGHEAAPAGGVGGLPWLGAALPKRQRSSEQLSKCALPTCNSHHPTRAVG